MHEHIDWEDFVRAIDWAKRQPGAIPGVDLKIMESPSGGLRLFSTGSGCWQDASFVDAPPVVASAVASCQLGTFSFARSIQDVVRL
jgi:hypothetical protein